MNQGLLLLILEQILLKNNLRRDHQRKVKEWTPIAIDDFITFENMPENSKLIKHKREPRKTRELHIATSRISNVNMKIVNTS